jgi:hypothetical protein
MGWTCGSELLTLFKSSGIVGQSGKNGQMGYSGNSTFWSYGSAEVTRFVTDTICYTQ